MPDAPPVSQLHRVNLVSCWIASVVAVRRAYGIRTVPPVPVVAEMFNRLEQLELSSRGWAVEGERRVRQAIREHYRSGEPCTVALQLNLTAALELDLDGSRVVAALLRTTKAHGSTPLYRWS